MSVDSLKSSVLRREFATIEGADEKAAKIDAVIEKIESLGVNEIITIYDEEESVLSWDDETRSALSFITEQATQLQGPQKFDQRLYILLNKVGASEKKKKRARIQKLQKQATAHLEAANNNLRATLETLTRFSAQLEQQERAGPRSAEETLGNIIIGASSQLDDE